MLLKDSTPLYGLSVLYLPVPPILLNLCCFVLYTGTSLLNVTKRGVTPFNRTESHLTRLHERNPPPAGLSPAAHSTMTFRPFRARQDEFAFIDATHFPELRFSVFQSPGPHNLSFRIHATSLPTGRLKSAFSKAVSTLKIQLEYSTLTTLMRRHPPPFRWHGGKPATQNRV